MKKRNLRLLSTILAGGMLLNLFLPLSVNAAVENGWEEIDGKNYWYEDSIRQGTYDDPKGVLGDGTVRGREIYDPVSDGWYWLDAVYDGAKAVNKEVWMPYIYQNEADWGEEELTTNASESGDMAEQVIREIKNKSGKWVRYDVNGKMYKGWYKVEGNDANIYPQQAGNSYYYDTKTGLMAKGEIVINGVKYNFDNQTGVCLSGTRIQEDGFIPTSLQVQCDIMRLKEEYPTGMSWTNDNYYEWNGGGGYSGGYGCAGFAFMLSDAAFGDLPSREHEDFSNIKVGDILRIKNDTHSVIVIEVKGNSVVVAEGNYNNSVHWGREFSFATLQEIGTYVTTRYPEYTEEVVVHSGQDGDVIWNITNTGKLTLTGVCGEKQADGWGTEGASGWREYRNEIVTAYVDLENATNLTDLFYNLSNIRQIDLSNLDTSKVTDMSYMFAGCSSLKRLDLSKFDTSEVTNMRYMFASCFSLEELDLRNFNTSKVTNMSGMFESCKITGVLDLSSFDTSNVTNMACMFSNSRIESFDLSSFDTSMVTSMAWMFSYTELENLDISSFDTGKATFLKGMFESSRWLKEILVGPNWVIKEDTNITDMFKNCGTDHVTLKK